MIIFPQSPTPMDLCPIASCDVIDVEPLQFARVTSQHGGMSTGEWSSGPGHFYWTYWVDEVITITQGSAMIRDCSDPLQAWNHIEVGDKVHFVAGAKAEWCVEKYVRKDWVIRQPSLPRRLALRLQIFLQKWSPIPARPGESDERSR